MTCGYDAEMVSAVHTQFRRFGDDERVDEHPYHHHTSREDSLLVVDRRYIAKAHGCHGGDHPIETGRGGDKGGGRRWFGRFPVMVDRSGFESTQWYSTLRMGGDWWQVWLVMLALVMVLVVLAALVRSGDDILRLVV